MHINIIFFIKRTYKVAGAFVIIVGFFLFYNLYLVDRSVINLRIALAEASKAKTVEDFEKIRPLLKITLLKEISAKKISSQTLISIEMAQGTSSTAKSMEQIEDIKFYLKTLVKEKEKTRGGFLSALDRVNTYIYAPQTKIPQKDIEGKVKSLLARIDLIKEKTQLQEAYFDLGNLYIQLSDIDKADDAFVKSIGLNPKSDIALKSRFNLAWAYKTLGEYKKAAVYFEGIVAEFPQDELAVTSEFQIADILYKKGEYLKARDQYAALADKYPKSELLKFALYQAGYISLYNLNDKEAALRFFARLEQAMPEAAIAQHANTHLKGVVGKDYRLKGFKLLEQKRYNEAIEIFQKAINVVPKDAGSYSGWGLGLYFLNKKDEAIDKAKRAIKLSAEDEMAIINSVYIYLASGNTEGAINICEEILSKKIEFKDARFYYNTGCAYLEKKEFDKARGMFYRAIRLNPDFAYAYNNLGYTLWANGDYSDAIMRYSQARDLNRDDAIPHLNLGFAYFYLERPEEAWREFSAVLKIDPVNKKAKSYLGEAEKALGYKPE